jgi:hypothetical protein
MNAKLKEVLFIGAAVLIASATPIRAETQFVRTEGGERNPLIGEYILHPDYPVAESQCTDGNVPFPVMYEVLGYGRTVTVWQCLRDDQAQAKRSILNRKRKAVAFVGQQSNV